MFVDIGIMMALLVYVEIIKVAFVYVSVIIRVLRVSMSGRQ